jgi:hypothetical protein
VFHESIESTHFSGIFFVCIPSYVVEKMIPAIAKFMFPKSANESPSKSEDDSQHLTVITEPHLHDEVGSVQSSASLDTSGYASMKKDELVSIVEKLGIRLDKRATKAQIIKLLATTSLGVSQQSVDSEDSHQLIQSQESNESVAPTPSRIRSQSAKIKISENADSSRSSPARTRSTAASTTGSRSASQVRTPSTRKTSRYLDKHALRSPKELHVSHQKTLDPQFEYYDSTETSRFAHDLRSPNELQLSHNKTLDPQYEYYSGVETIEGNTRVTRSSKKAASSTKSSRSSPVKRRRSNSVSNQSSVPKTPSQPTTDSEMATEFKGRRHSRQTSSRATPKQVSPVVSATRSRQSTVSSNVTKPVGSKRKQSVQPSVSKRARKETMEREDQSESESVDHCKKTQTRDITEGSERSTAKASKKRQVQQSHIRELQKNERPMNEEDSNNSDEDMDDDDEDDMAEQVDDEADGYESSEIEHHELYMEQIEEGEDDYDENEEVDLPVTSTNSSAGGFMAAFLAAGKDTAGVRSSEVMDVASDEEEDDLDSEDEEEENSEDEEEDIDSEGDDEQEDVVEEVQQSQTTVAYNFPANGFMAAFLAAGNKKEDTVTAEAMDLVHSDDEKVTQETKTIPIENGDATLKPLISAAGAASPSGVAVKVAEPSVSKVSTESNVHPAVAAFNKLGSKLLTAATAVESQSSSSVEMLSVQEYDLLKTILNKIKPAEVVDDEVGQKRTLPQSIEEEANATKLQDGQESALKRRRTSTDSRLSYDGELWNFSDPSEEVPLSPSLQAFSAPRVGSLGVFSRSSFGGGLFGRVQTPYNHNFRASIGSTIDGNTLSASKAMFDRRMEEAATVFPASTSAVTSATDSGSKKTSHAVVSFNLGSNVPLSGGKSLSLGGRSSYTPQFRSSAASFVSGSASSSRDNSLLSAEESSMSYLEKRRLKRQLQASASATVARQILDTLGSISSPSEKQVAPVGLLTQEANILESGTSKIPDFQSKLDANQQKNTLGSVAASKTLNENPIVSVASNLAPTAKVSFALSANEPEPNSKFTGFFAPPTPIPISAIGTSNDRHVKFAADPVAKSSVSVLTPAAKGYGSMAADDDFVIEEDDDQIIVVEKKRSSIGSTPFKPSLASSSVDNDEFFFDEPLTVKGVDEDFAERESVTNIRYAFTPPSKLKRRKAVVTSTPAAASKAISKPSNSAANKDNGSDSTLPASAGTNIWNMKANPNEKKCLTCLVTNDKNAVKCESCGTSFPVASGASNTTSSGSIAPAANIWNIKANPNEKKCQVCLVKNDKSATKCESCGSMFPAAAEGTNVATTTAAPSFAPATATATATAATSLSSAVKPAAGGFIFGITPGTAPAAPASGASFTFGVAKPINNAEGEKATVAAPVEASTSDPAKASFFSAPAESASKKDATPASVPPAMGSFGAPKPPSAETTAKPAFSGGFTFGGTPAVVDNKVVSKAAAEEDVEEQPTRKRRVQEEETGSTQKSTAPTFGISSSTDASSAPIVFGAPSPAGINDNPPSSTSTSSFSFGAPTAPVVDDKKKDDAAVAPVGGFAGFGATSLAPGTFSAAAAAKPAFTFGAPTTTSATTANDSSKPGFGAAPAPVVVTSAALPSFALFGSSSSPAAAPTVASLPKEASTEKPGVVPFGGSSVPTTASTSASALPSFGSTSGAAPFNAFAPVPASSATPSVKPASSGPFGITSLPASAPAAGPAFGFNAALKPAEATSSTAPSNPFGGMGTTSAASEAAVAKPTNAANPFAASFDTSSAAPGLVFKPPTSTAFAPAAVSMPAVTASVSNPFASSFGAAPGPAPAAAVGGPFNAPAPSLPASSFAFGSAAPKSVPPANSGPFGSAPASSTNPLGPFGSAVAPSAPSNPFGGSAASSNAGSNPFGGPPAANSSGAGVFGAPGATSTNVFAGSFGQQPPPTNSFSFGAGAGGMGGLPTAPSLTPQTSFSSSGHQGNAFPSAASHQLNAVLGGGPSSAAFGSSVGSLPPNPMMSNSSGGGFNLGSGGGVPGGGGQPRKVLKIKKKT